MAQHNACARGAGVDDEIIGIVISNSCTTVHRQAPIRYHNTIGRVIDQETDGIIFVADGKVTFNRTG